jgi:hypothetical protein
MEAYVAKRNVPDGEIGPMDEKTFKGFLKKLDLAQVKVDETAEEAKSARSAKSAIWKEFKKQGGKPETLRAVMALRSLDEGDLIQQEEDRKRYSEWMKLPIYTQTSLFEETPADTDADTANEDDTDMVESAAPAPVPPLTARARGGRKGPKLVEPENTSGSPLN